MVGRPAKAFFIVLIFCESRFEGSVQKSQQYISIVQAAVFINSILLDLVKTTMYTGASFKFLVDKLVSYFKI